MTHTPEHKIEEAKDHLHAAKNDVQSATQEKVVEKVAVMGEKIKDGIDHLVEKITPEHKA
jgi:hypothetical protein